MDVPKPTALKTDGDVDNVRTRTDKKKEKGGDDVDKYQKNKDETRKYSKESKERKGG